MSSSIFTTNLIRRRAPRKDIHGTLLGILQEKKLYKADQEQIFLENILAHPEVAANLIEKDQSIIQTLKDELKTSKQKYRYLQVEHRNLTTKHKKLNDDYDNLYSTSTLCCCFTSIFAISATGWYALQNHDKN